eukprot:s2822_g4.t1
MCCAYILGVPLRRSPLEFQALSLLVVVPVGPGPLPSGELEVVKTFHGRFGNFIDCPGLLETGGAERMPLPHRFACLPAAMQLT